MPASIHAPAASRGTDALTRISHTPISTWGPASAGPSSERTCAAKIAGRETSPVAAGTRVEKRGRPSVSAARVDSAPAASRGRRALTRISHTPIGTWRPASAGPSSERTSAAKIAGRETSPVAAGTRVEKRGRQRVLPLPASIHTLATSSRNRRHSGNRTMSVTLARSTRPVSRRLASLY
jgi:hypothetical protein